METLPILFFCRRVSESWLFYIPFLFCVLLHTIDCIVFFFFFFFLYDMGVDEVRTFFEVAKQSTLVYITRIHRASLLSILFYFYFVNTLGKLRLFGM